jgi:hypothetical protein
MSLNPIFHPMMSPMMAGIGRGSGTGNGIKLSADFITQSILSGTFTRASTSPWQDSDGNLRLALIDQPVYPGRRWATTVAEGALLGVELVADLTAWDILGVDANNTLTRTATSFHLIQANSDTIIQFQDTAILEIGKSYEVTTNLTENIGSIKYDMNGASTTLSSGTVTISSADRTKLSIYRAAVPADVEVHSFTVKEIIPQALTTDINGDLIPGLLGWQSTPDIVNKLRIKAFNATDLSGQTDGGDAARVVGLVDYSTELAAAGLDVEHTTGTMAEIDNTGGSVPSYVDMTGPLSTTVHCLDSYIVGGTGNIGLSDGTGQTAFAASASIVRRFSLNVSPSTGN